MLNIITKLIMVNNHYIGWMLTCHLGCSKPWCTPKLVVVSRLIMAPWMVLIGTTMAMDKPIYR